MKKAAGVNAAVATGVAVGVVITVVLARGVTVAVGMAVGVAVGSMPVVTDGTAGASGPKRRQQCYDAQSQIVSHSRFSPIIWFPALVYAYRQPSGFTPRDAGKADMADRALHRHCRTSTSLQ